MYYLITTFGDGSTEVLTMRRMDRQLVSLYRYCIGGNDNKSLLLNGMLLEWQDRKNELTFVEVKDLIMKLKFLEVTDLSDDYEELKRHIIHNYYDKGEKVSV